jgi:hypothetical protein
MGCLLYGLRFILGFAAGSLLVEHMFLLAIPLLLVALLLCFINEDGWVFKSYRKF